MLYANGFTMHALSQVRCNFVVQDVDTFWYKDPLEYFQGMDSEADIVFSDDGARWRWYAPYDANTGLFYVRSNERTRHLLTSFLSLSDNVMARNDQSTMNMLLQLHSNQYGLHVKTISREEPIFLSGFHLWRRKDMMKGVMKNELIPYTYHANWNHGGEEKKQHLLQLGLWHLQSHCSNVTTETAVAPLLTLGASKKSNNGSDLMEHCCLAEPSIACFYRDVPSKIPCMDSPLKNEGGVSFW